MDNMNKWWHKTIIYLIIIALISPSILGLSDFAKVKKAQAEEIGDYLLTDKDILSLQGSINEPGDNGTASLNIATGEKLVKLQSSLAQTALSGKISFSEEWENAFHNTNFAEITNEFFLSYWNFVNDRQKLVLKQQDIDAIKQNKVDRRIKKFLLYLVTPKYLDGAGHELINVSRIVASNGDVNNDVEPSILTHSFPDDGMSQAADIAIVDYLRCTLIVKKKNWVGRKKTETTPKAPQPIKIEWQSGKFGSAQDTLGLSLNQMAQGLGATSFMDMLDQLGLSEDEYSGDEFKNNINLGDVAKYIGKGIFEQVLLSPTRSWKGSNFDEIMENLGRAIISDQLGLPRASVKGDTLDEIETSVGRYMIEKSLNLPFGSLEGKTSIDILKNTGSKKLEKEIGLPEGSIDYANIHSKEELHKKIGQRYIEGNMYISKNSLNSDSYDEFVKALGTERFNWISKNPGLMDERLELPPDATKNFLQNHVLSSYKILIGENIINKSINIYQNYLWDDPSSSSVKTNDSPTTEDGDGNPQGNKRDEAFDTPEGTIDQFLSGDLSSLEKIGAYEIAKTLSTSDEQREIIYHWLVQYKTKIPKDFVALSEIDSLAAKQLYSNDSFHLPGLSTKTNPDFNLNETFQNYQVNENDLLSKFQGLVGGDIDDIFIYNQSADAFQHAGKQYLLEGLNNGQIGEKIGNAVEPYLDQANKIINDINFYKYRIDDIRARTRRIETSINATTANPVLKDNIKIVKDEFDFISNHLAINAIKTSINNANKSWKIIDTEIEKPENQALKDQVKEDVNGIKKDIYELRKGESSDIDYNTAATNSGEGSSEKTDDSKKLITKKDLVFLVKNPKEIPQFAKNIACKKVETQLDLPTYSLRYFLQATEKSVNSLKSSVGQATAEERFELPNNSFQPSASDGNYIIGLWRSLHASMLSQDPSLTDEKFEEKVSEMFNIPFEWKKSEYHASGSSLIWDLILYNNPAKWKPYESNLEEVDNKLSIQKGSTLDFLTNKITLNRYNELIGMYQLGFKLTDSLYNDGINFMGEKLTTEDLYNILIGHSLDPFAKIGGRKIDNMLGVPEGYGYKLVTAQNDNQRLEVLAEIGGLKLSNMLGIDRVINLIGIQNSKDLLNNIGNANIEGKIGLLPKTFSDSLDETIKQNGYGFVLAFGLPNVLEGKIDIDWDELRDDIVNANYESKTYKQFTNQVKNNTEITNLIKQTLNPNVFIGGIILPNPIYMSISDLMTGGASDEEVNKARTFQYRISEIDRELGLPANTTVKLLKGDITPAQYRSQATDELFVNLAALKLDDLLGLEEKYHFTLSGSDGLVQIYQDLKSDDLDTQRSGQAKLYDVFCAAFTVNLDQKAGLTPGTIKSIILNPSETRGILINQGLIKIEDMLGLGPKCQEEGNCSDLSKYGFNGFLQQTYNAYQAQYDKTCVETGGNPIDKSTCEKAGWTAAKKSAIALVENGAATFIGERVFKETKIQLPIEDSLRIVHGDFKIFGYVKIAQYAAQQLQKVEAGEAIPPDYMLSYGDVKFCFEGDPLAENEIRERSQSQAATEFDKLYPVDFLMPSAAINPFLSPEVYNPTPTINVTNIYGYNQDQSTSYFPPPQELEVSETISDEGMTDDQYQDSVLHYETLPTTTLTLNNETYSFLRTPPATTTPPDIFERFTQRNQEKTDYIKQSGDAAVIKQRKFWRTEPMYKFLDSQMFLKNKHIPRGFSRAMIEGNTTDRVYALSGMIELSIKDNAGENSILNYLPDGTFQTLINYFSKKPSERDFSVIQNATICGGIDNYLRMEIFKGKDFPPEGFTQALFAASQNHWKLNTKELNGIKFPSFNQIMVDFAWSKVTSWIDERFEWSPGTAYAMYQMYKGFETARKAYIAAKAAGDIVKQAKANGDIAAAKAALYTYVLTTVFKKQLSALDEKLGLVPGSMAQMVGIGVQLIMNVNPWIAIAILVVTNLFTMRVTSIEYMCTPCGYYPGYQPNIAPTGFVPFSALRSSLPIPDNYDSECPIESFDAYKDEQYREGLKKSASYKAKMIMKDSLDIGEVTGDEFLRPTQVIMNNLDDVQENAYLITELYGSIDQRGYMGVWANENVTQHVHVGY